VQPYAVREAAIRTWHAVRLDKGRFGIFDTFKDEAGRDTHLTG
jgi:hypothetical protein